VKDNKYKLNELAIKHEHMDTLRWWHPHLHPIPVNQNEKQLDEAFFNIESNLDDLFEFLHILGFDLETSYVIYYVNKDEIYLSNMVKSRTVHSGERDSYKKTHFITPDILKKHFLSVHKFSKHFYKGKTVIIENDILDGRKRKIEIVDDQKELITTKTRSIACHRLPDSQTVAIDIDDHGNIGRYSMNARNILKKILSSFHYKEPLLLEMSYENGGFHLYYRFDKSVDVKRLQKLKKYLNDTCNISIEIIIRNALKLPASATYQPVRISNLNEIENDNEKDLIFDPYPSFRNCIEDVRWNYDGRTIPVTILDQILQHTPNGEEQAETALNKSGIKKEKESRTQKNQVFKFNNQHIPKQNKEWFQKNFSITEGNRRSGARVQFHIADTCFRMSMTFEEFYNMSMCCNVSSKDLSYSEEHARKESRKIWDYITENHTPYTSVLTQDGFISNMHRLSPSLKKEIRLYTRALISRTYIKYRKHKRKHHRATLALLLEMFGQILYKEETGQTSEQNNSYYIPSSAHTFPYEFLKKMKEHYRIGCDIEEVFNNIVYKGFLLCPIPINSKKWKKGKFSRHFQLPVLRYPLHGEKLLIFNLKIATHHLNNLKFTHDKEMRKMLVRSVFLSECIGFSIKEDSHTLSMDIIMYHLGKRFSNSNLSVSYTGEYYYYTRSFKIYMRILKIIEKKYNSDVLQMIYDCKETRMAV